MTDNSVWNAMLEEFNSWQKNDKTTQVFEQMLENGKATYTHAEAYSKHVAKKWSDLLKKRVGGDIAQTLEKETADAIEEALTQCYWNSSNYSTSVQEIINQTADLNIKAINGKLDKTRISHLLKKLADGEDTQWLLEEPVVENISRSAVTDTIIANAELHKSAGLIPYVERKIGSGGCCEWCQSMAGKYVLGEEPRDFWKIHKHCNCSITYMPSRGRHEKITYETDKSGKRTKNTVAL